MTACPWLVNICDIVLRRTTYGQLDERTYSSHTRLQPSASIWDVLAQMAGLGLMSTVGVLSMVSAFEFGATAYRVMRNQCRIPPFIAYPFAVILTNVRVTPAT